MDRKQVFYPSQHAQDIIADNLMSIHEIRRYLSDDLRAPLDKINGIVLSDMHTTEMPATCKKLPHHRYNLAFDSSSGTLHIQPIEGVLRKKHISVECELLSTLHGRPVLLIDTTHTETTLQSEWLSCLEQVLEGRPISGVVIGSIWNFNFYVQFLSNPRYAEMYTSTVNPHDLQAYVAHQLNLVVIEDEFIHGRITLSDGEKIVFQEGHLPHRDEQRAATVVIERVEDSELKLRHLRNQKDLIAYAQTDYLYFSDIEAGTKKFGATLCSNGVRVYEHPYLTYQLITTPGNATLLNLSWANADTLADVLHHLSQTHPLTHLYMYGKCGAVAPSFAMGSLVVPVRSHQNGTTVTINNRLAASGTIQTVSEFVHVDSPLVETHAWAAEWQMRGSTCVDMELGPVIRALPPGTPSDVVYYVSDQPAQGRTLADRLDLLPQRLACTQMLTTSMMSQTALV